MFTVSATSQTAAEASWFPAGDCAAAFDVDEDAAVADCQVVGFFVGGWNYHTLAIVHS